MRKPVLSTVFAGTLLITTLGSAAVVIRTAPPAPASVVVVGRAPSPRHVWIPGYYNGVNGRYVWVPGRWIVPPRPGAVWVPPRWDSRSNGYVFVAGRWR
jgi:hypothetical protein